LGSDRLSRVSAISREQLLAYVREERYAVEASITADGVPQAAVVGVVVTDAFEIVFDTVQTSRKARNLRQQARVALVFGSTAAAASRTIQIEGTADEPSGAELDALLECYFAAFPDGRQRRLSGNLTYFRVKPSWIRCSDYGTVPPTIVEFAESELS